MTSNVCFYCEKFSENRSYCGIDRVDNDIGYILSNCVSCCSNCNDIKSNSTFKQIEKIYFGMIKFKKINNV